MTRPRTPLIVALLAGLSLLAVGCSELGLEPPPPSPVPALDNAVAPDSGEKPIETRRDAALSTPAPAAAEPVDEVYPATGSGRPRLPAVRSDGDEGGGDLTVNFQDTDLRQVIRVILGDLLGYTYVVDAEVDGRVTLRTVRPLTRTQMLRMLDGLLGGYGLAAIYDGNSARIVRQELAAGASPARRAGAGQAGYGVDIVPLDHIAAPQMLQLLEPVVRDGTVAAGSGGSRVLLVSGSAAEREAARRAIAVFDVDQMANQSVALVGLTNADAADVVEELDQIFGDTAAGPLAGLVRFTSVARMNAVLAIASQPEHLREARTWIRRLDRTADADRRRLFVYFVKHATAAALVDTLRGAFDDAPAARSATPRSSSRPGADDVGASASAPSAAVSATGSGAADRPRFMADAGSNSILTWATGREYELISDVLVRLDITPLQVVIEGTVIELTLRDALRFGLQYFIESGEFSSIFTRGTDATSVTPQLPGLGVAIGFANDSRVVIDALSELTDVRVVSSPQIMVLDGGTARLHVGDQVPIVTRTSSATVTDDTRVVNEIEYRDTGVTLNVTPRVKSSGVVQLEIGQEVSDVIRTTTSGIDSPTIQQRSITSQTAVDSGQTVLLAGLIREENTDSDTGIPVLRQLPVVGPLFGTTNQQTERTELVVLITPRVVRNRVDAGDVTRELLQRYQGVLNGLSDPPAGGTRPAATTREKTE